MTTNLHPAVAAYLADSAAMGLRPYVDLAPADARTQFASVMAARLGADHQPRPMEEVVDRTVAVDGRDIPLRLADAVKKSLVSDVPVGLLLSGGIDSSALLTEMVKETGEPGDHEDDVESFYPEHRVGTASKIRVHTGHVGDDRLTQYIAYE